MKDVRSAARKRAGRPSLPVGVSVETQEQQEKWAVFRQIATANGTNICQSSGFTMLALDMIAQEEIQIQAAEILHSIAICFRRGLSPGSSKGGLCA